MSLALALLAVAPGSRATPAIHDRAEFMASIYAAHTTRSMIRAIAPRSVAMPHKNVDEPMAFVGRSKYLNKTGSRGKTFAFRPRRSPLRNDTS
ncbi:hypothetical protein G3N96_03195 [Burkholderia sp. Se-20373]|uniref:hypothetical protein n=1 Tax=Burkholderia TaxID=32008 RepID=UPI000F59B261|nr:MULTISPECIES: hypothetical protein [Burkholderia]MBN3744441.1 hypothetical protein [Burkholderia sp. Se-20373]